MCLCLFKLDIERSKANLIVYIAKTVLSQRKITKYTWPILQCIVGTYTLTLSILFLGFWAWTCLNWLNPNGPWSRTGRRGRRWPLRTSQMETSNSLWTSSEDTTSPSADLTPGTTISRHSFQSPGFPLLWFGVGRSHHWLLSIRLDLKLTLYCNLCVFSKPPVSARSARPFTEQFTAPVSSQTPVEGSDWPLGQVTHLSEVQKKHQYEKKQWQMPNLIESKCTNHVSKAEMNVSRVYVLCSPWSGPLWRCLSSVQFSRRLQLKVQTPAGMKRLYFHSGQCRSSQKIS